MSSKPPKSFAALAKNAANPAAGGYPYQIRGADLDENFVYATPDFSKEHFKETTSSGNGGHQQRVVKLLHPVPAGESTGQSLHWNNNEWTLSPTPNDGGWLYWTENDVFAKTPKPEHSGILLYWNNENKTWVFVPAPTQDGQIPQWNNENKLWKFIGTPTREGQLLKWNHQSKTWTPFSGGAEGSFPQWDAENGWESMGSGTARGQLLRWDADSKNWGPVSGSPGALLQWDATEGWQADIGGSSNGQLLNFNNETKKWQTFTPGENSIMYYRNNAWTILTPPATGTFVLGSKDGVMQWIGTEEC
jgi:hypothetical protein